MIPVRTFHLKIVSSNDFFSNYKLEMLLFYVRIFKDIIHTTVMVNFLNKSDFFISVSIFFKFSSVNLLQWRFRKHCCLRCQNFYSIPIEKIVSQMQLLQTWFLLLLFKRVLLILEAQKFYIFCQNAYFI